MYGDIGINIPGPPFTPNDLGDSQLLEKLLFDVSVGDIMYVDELRCSGITLC